MLAERPLSFFNPQEFDNNTHTLPRRASIGQKKFISRTEVGKLLATLLKYHRPQSNAAVLAIKPSATLIGAEIAKSLELPLDLFLVHSFKVHDLTVGAVANGWDGVLLKEQIISGCQVSEETLKYCIDSARNELVFKAELYSPLNLPLPAGEDGTVILVTDGIQTGQNARCTIAILRKMGYRGKIVLVAGVIGSDAQRTFMKECDDVIALVSPRIVGGVDNWYNDSEVKDDAEEIRRTLQQ
ncbi:3275_t:CDS:2 [Paraglomus brasilianum]|uniref:3275_t:CDS:1 n=1 Tax=Paraglomus brasilianum TaxID=144538 RepID=A0A9N9A2M3_9GLOM|nr:3275_t:CDS:2 [Paraglomus brasilianum]